MVAHLVKYECDMSPSNLRVSKTELKLFDNGFQIADGAAN